MVFKDKRVRNRTDLSDLSIATRASLQAPAHAGFLSFNILSPCELVSQLYLLVITIYSDKLLHYTQLIEFVGLFGGKKEEVFRSGPKLYNDQTN